ncbi:hypothetical protein JCM21900_000662 [Sporobolomyces salmonicolor]
MSGPFATPTYRATNPLEDALAVDEATARPPAPPISSSAAFSPPRLQPQQRVRTFDSPSVRSAGRTPPRLNPLVSPKRPGSLHSNAGSLASNAKSLASPSKLRPSERIVRQGSSGVNKGDRSSVGPKQPHAQEAWAATQAPKPEELLHFAALCRKQYYENDAGAARQVGQILQKLPPSSLTAYSRTMANVRSEYHRDKEIERRLHVESTLAAILPGSTIKAALSVPLEDGVGGGTAAMRSSKARAVRHIRFKEFLDANCVKAMPGTHPFFRSLYAALWLQALEPGKGGAGRRQVEWEVDVAVFSEAGGGDGWARDAAEALKGILGMTERIKEPSHTDTIRSSYFSSVMSDTSSTAGDDNPPPLDPSSPGSSDNDDEAEPRSLPNEHGLLNRPVTAASIGSQGKKQPPAVPPHRGSLRSRSTSDPFLDPRDKAKAQAKNKPTPPALPPRQPSADAPPPSPDPTADADASTPFLPPIASPATPAAPLDRSPPAPSRPSHSRSAPAVRPQIRTFTLPAYLTNPELRSLCRLFPEFVSSPARAGARFRSPSTSSMDRTRAQEDAGVGGGPARVGHGELRIGKGERAEGWQGTVWERFVAWFQRLFGRG